MSEKRQLKKYEELTIRDDFMFGKVMEDSNLFRELLECLLGRSVGELEKVELQKEIHFASEGKPIRMDLFDRESDNGTFFDAEMEKLNNKSVEAHMLPQRARFYQGSMDIDFMDKGASYKGLPESFVIFICTFDPFGEGLSCYSFHETCDENKNLLLKDGTTKMFFNCCYSGDNVSEGLKNLFGYIMTGEAEDDLTRKLESAVSKGRMNEKWRTQYMKEWVLLQDAKDEGYEEGREEGREYLRNMLRNGKKAEEIAELCGCPLEEVRKLEKEILVKM